MTAGSLLTGCPDRTISKVVASQGRVEYKDIPLTINRDLDLLFLIDDSPSMTDKQLNLATNFPNFVNVLQTIQGGLPDVHIGVATSDLGSSGANGTIGPSVGTAGQQGACVNNGKNGVLQLGGATGLVTGTYISDVANTTGGRTVNYTGTLPDTFGKMAKVGDFGCGFEQHIEGVKQALTDGRNPGFIRADAYLAVVFIADEDDCSLQDPTLLQANTTTLGPLQSFRCTDQGITCDVGGTTVAQMREVGVKSQCHPNDDSQYLTQVSPYVDFLKTVKGGDETKIVMAAISGPTDMVATELRAPSAGQQAIPALAHSCTYQGSDGTEVADPAIRIKFLIDQFPNRNTFSTICQQDLSGGLQEIADLLKTVIGDPCIDGQLEDVDPNTDGPQYDCSVSDVTMQGQPGQHETVIPACDDGHTVTPCWYFDTMTMSCPDPAHPELVIDRGGTTPAPDTHLVAYCVTKTPECSDGIDNDGDGLIDYPSDPDCSSSDDDSE
ncbi:MAG TPA: hypothetical protein VGM88_13695 [Kofleriaceae bacterium]